jgi:hypothetical protein
MIQHYLPRFKGNLRTKAITLAITLGTLPVLIIGAVAYHFANQSITQDVLKFRQYQATILAQNVNSFMFDRFADIQILASEPIFTDTHLFDEDILEHRQAFIDHFAKTYRVYDSIAYADLDGNILVQSEGETLSNQKSFDYFQQALQTGHAVLTSPRRSTEDEAYFVYLAAPVKDPHTQETVAVVRSRMPVDRVSDFLHQTDLSGAEIYLIDESGQIFISEDEEDLGTPIEAKFSVLAEMPRHDQGFTQIAYNADEEKNEVVAVALTPDLAGMPNPHWSALVDIETATAFRTQRWLLMVVLIGTGITATLVSIIAVILSNRVTHSLKEVAMTIASSASEIAATVEQQEKIASAQAASVHQTTVTMENLYNSSQLSSEQSRIAAFSAEQVSQLATTGTQAVDQTLADMVLLKEKVRAIAQTISQLNNQTDQIGHISDLVGDLARQTNMLALNAAIEAVRAGDHGKGFAVVATEIRNLADQSRRSAESISALVDDVQSAIHFTAQATDEGTLTVEKGVTTVYGTADTFTSVANAIVQVVQSSQNIAFTAEQQTLSIQQVVDAMNSLNQAATQTANGITQTRVGTLRLKETAETLESVV